MNEVKYVLFEVSKYKNINGTYLGFILKDFGNNGTVRFKIRPIFVNKAVIIDVFSEEIIKIFSNKEVPNLYRLIYE